MKTVRIGNDIRFTWTVRNLAEVGGTKEVRLYHVNKSVPEVITYSVSGNKITGTFRGKDQTEKGMYRLLLQVNGGSDEMVTLDYVNAFSLCGVCDFGIVSGTYDDAIETAVVEMESELSTSVSPGYEQVQSDWEETDTDNPAYIRNKPTIPDGQIQADFNQADQSAKDFIKNKPNMAAIQQWLAQTVCGGAYNSTLKRLEFKDKDNTLLFSIDATAFIKDGMVTNVAIVNGNLVITFNTDSGLEPISIPITDIFNPNNYYTRNDIDLTFATIASIADMATKTWVNNQVSGKEDKVEIVSASGTTLTAEVGKYYTLSNVGTLAITLPTIAAGTTKVQTVTFYIAAGSSPAVTFTSTHPVYYSDGFEIAADSTYEVNALWNGAAWIVASVTIIVE